MATHTPHEVLVPEDRFIISKTDSRGTITYVNRTFMEVADYPHVMLIGQPHNIIRHPDMPKAAFYHLWHTIKQGEEWFGYVKNRTRTGNFYWVFAHVTTDYQDGKPIGYYSVRRTMPDALKPTIETLYAEMRQIESQHDGKAGIEAALKHLMEAVHQAGHESYRDFILQSYLQHAPTCEGAFA